MPPGVPVGIAAMLGEARRLSGLNQGDFAVRVGTSKRTLARIVANKATAYPYLLADAAKLVYPLDRALAKELAKAAGATLISLGLEPPPPAPEPPPPPPEPPPSPARRPPSIAHLVDSVVCAAAEAIGVTPQAIRPALRAAFARAVEVDLKPEELHQGLVASSTPATGPEAKS